MSCFGSLIKKIIMNVKEFHEVDPLGLYVAIGKDIFIGIGGFFLVWRFISHNLLSAMLGGFIVAAIPWLIFASNGNSKRSDLINKKSYGN